MASVSFTVHGVPAPQGSKAPWGGESNPRTRPWRAAVTAEAAAAMGERVFIDGPIHLSCTFYFPRPKSHYRTGKNAGRLKDTAPHYHANKPDLDKLIRAIGDSLSGVVFRDDSEVVAMRPIKYWGEPARVEITVERLA